MSTTDTPTETYEQIRARHATERRAAYISGLRKLADVLDAHPEVRTPADGSGPWPASINIYSVDLDAFRAFVACTEARVELDSEGKPRAQAALDGLHVCVTPTKDAVEQATTAVEVVERPVVDLDAFKGGAAGAGEGR